MHQEHFRIDQDCTNVYSGIMNTTKICQQCQQEFEKVKTDSYDYFINRRMYCSATCSGLARKGKSMSRNTQFKKGENIGKKNPFWKTGKHQTAQGYIVVLVGIKQYQLEHRYVMEQHLGRKLDSSEHVHHLNHIKTDNRIENLIIMSAKEHGTMHANERWAR